MSEFVKWLDTPETWETVAGLIGTHDYTYDLGDSSHRLDVVQIVLTAAAKAARAEEEEAIARVERWKAANPGAMERIIAADPGFLS